MKSKRGFGKIVSYALVILGELCVLLPFYITVITAFKTTQESAQNFFAFPKSFYLGNFISVFQKAGYFTYFKNSAIVTVVSLVLIYILVTMAAYAIARNPKHSKYYNIIFVMFILGMFVPFQVIMVPLVQFMGKLGLSNKTGLILLHVTFAAMQGVFLLVNYITSIPEDLEEAACIDGCTTVQSYVKIVLPLIKPMTSTVLVLNALWVWNDFQMPLMILNKLPETWTFASYLVAMVPVLAAYIAAQKYIVDGLTAGESGTFRLSLQRVDRAYGESMERDGILEKNTGHLYYIYWDFLYPVFSDNNQEYGGGQAGELPVFKSVR